MFTNAFNWPCSFPNMSSVNQFSDMSALRLPRARFDLTNREPKKTSFLIEDILSDRPRDESKLEIDCLNESTDELYNKNEDDDEVESGNFTWLQCTRYKPPKLPSK